MKYILFNEDGTLAGRFDSVIHGDQIPAQAVQVDDELFHQTINEQDGVWKLVEGEVIKEPLPEPTEAETLKRQIAAIDLQLKASDDKTLRTRGAREGDLLAYPVIALLKSTFTTPQLAALAQIEQALYANNPEYKRVKDEEAACIALRAERKVLDDQLDALS